ncbi:hypothetical protein [Flavobacterium sp. UBA7682]|uniref:hypothetical protein n=1 Tax=Flavobacterium sp. UBA7682 TaxID=1946560 RepID=UPI0025BA0D0F|nr:hypothetical protein [Flavobacterium sp. UBA7682]
MKYSLTLLIAFFFFTACQKERTLYLTDDIKRNFSYKPGSYWIYRDSATGREDSCYVIKNTTYFDETDYGSLIDYDKIERLEIKMKLATIHKGNKTNIEIEFLMRGNFLNALFGSDIEDVFGCYMPISEQTYQAKLPNTYIPFKNVSGENFDKVYEIPTASGMYYLNNVGLIKMKMPYYSVTYNWELVRHKVIK